MLGRPIWTIDAPAAQHDVGARCRRSGQHAARPRRAPSARRDRRPRALRPPDQAQQLARRCSAPATITSARFGSRPGKRLLAASGSAAELGARAAHDRPRVELERHARGAVVGHESELERGQRRHRAGDTDQRRPPLGTAERRRERALDVGVARRASSLGARRVVRTWRSVRRTLPTSRLTRSSDAAASRRARRRDELGAAAADVEHQRRSPCHGEARRARRRSELAPLRRRRSRAAARRASRSASLKNVVAALGVAHARSCRPRRARSTPRARESSA